MILLEHAQALLTLYGIISLKLQNKKLDEHSRSEYEAIRIELEKQINEIDLLKQK